MRDVHHVLALGGRGRVASRLGLLFLDARKEVAKVELRVSWVH